MGIGAAARAGIDSPVTSSEESAKSVIDLISTATKKGTLGRFIDANTKEEIPW